MNDLENELRNFLKNLVILLNAAVDIKSLKQEK